MGIREIDIGDQKLKIHELEAVCDSLTGRPLTGSWLWDSAVILSHWLASSPLVNLHNKSVLELGAGTGLPGLSAALLGASRVVLTDVAPLLPGLMKNVEANDVVDRVQVRELVWGTDELLRREFGEFDIVLMSDVFFDPEMMMALGPTVRRMCGKGSRVWAASEVRTWTAECLNELVSQGFRVTEFSARVGQNGEHNDGGRDAFAVYELIPPSEENCHVDV